MSVDDENVADAGEATAVQAAPEEGEAEQQKLNLTVDIRDIGPCRKHVAVTVSEADIAMLRDSSLDEFADRAEVPGFRVGRVPRGLLQKRFKSELSDQVKQKVLLQSLEQMSEENDIDPINQPDIDVDSLDIPDSGDFRYEFDVEVRPEFDIPDYTAFTIERPNGEVTDAELEAFKSNFLESYSVDSKVDRPAASGDTIVSRVLFTHDGKEIRDSERLPTRLRPTLRFRDAVVEGFDKLMDGVSAGDVKTIEMQISLQSSVVEMRGETVTAEFTVNEVREQQTLDLDKEFLEGFGCETEEEFDQQIRATLQRQVEFTQRQATREQVLSKITESADWDLPESLVQQQTENALRREILEMSQAGYTREQVVARENEIRQNAIENTRKALKEHFVLDRVATEENIECTQEDVEQELIMMASQNGESLRRLRARLVKSGMIDNLEAQLRERKAVDFILEHASFTDVEREPLSQNTVSAVPFAVCGNMVSSLIDDTAEETVEE